MVSRASVRSTLLLLVFALLACKLGKKEETAPSATATPEPTAAATPAATPSAAPAATDTPAAPTQVQTGVTTKKGDAGTTKDAGPTDASASSDASSGKNAACQSKCQGIMQACLTPSAKDGGLPSFGDPTKCQAAFNDCAKACK
jgi:hypothetical protein